MRMRVLAWRRSDPIDGDSGPLDFEFAHLLGTVSHVGVDVEPPPVEEVVPNVDPDIAPDVDPDPVVDGDPDPVADVAISRFAVVGLDDDRLPVVVKRRRGRRR